MLMMSELSELLVGHIKKADMAELIEMYNKGAAMIKKRHVEPVDGFCSIPLGRLLVTEMAKEVQPKKKGKKK